MLPVLRTVGGQEAGVEREGGGGIGIVVVVVVVVEPGGRWEQQPRRMVAIRGRSRRGGEEAAGRNAEGEQRRGRRSDDFLPHSGHGSQHHDGKSDERNTCLSTCDLIVYIIDRHTDASSPHWLFSSRDRMA